MTEGTNIIHELARVGLSALATALAVLVTYYVPRIAKAIEKRINIDIPDPLEAEAEQVAIQAIAYAEERGRAAAKRLGAKVPGVDKLDWAARYFRDHASAQVIDWLNDKVEDWIESRLGLLRMAARPVIEPIQFQPGELATESPGPSMPEAR